MTYLLMLLGFFILFFNKAFSDEDFQNDVSTTSSIQDYYRNIFLLPLKKELHETLKTKNYQKLNTIIDKIEKWPQPYPNDGFEIIMEFVVLSLDLKAFKVLLENTLRYGHEAAKILLEKLQKHLKIMLFSQPINFAPYSFYSKRTCLTYKDLQRQQKLKRKLYEAYAKFKLKHGIALGQREISHLFTLIPRNDFDKIMKNYGTTFNNTPYLSEEHASLKSNFIGSYRNYEYDEFHEKDYINLTNFIYENFKKGPLFSGKNHSAIDVLLSQSYSSSKDITLKEVREMYQKIKDTNQISTKVIEYLAYEIITRNYDLMIVFFDGDVNNLRSTFSNTLNVIIIDIKDPRAASTASAIFHEMTHAAIDRAFYYDSTPNPTCTKVIDELRSSPNCRQAFDIENEEDSFTLFQRQLRRFGECSNNDLLSHFTDFQEKLENALLKPLEKANKLLGSI